MITLATLSSATEQKVFNQAAKHMLTQNKRSVSSKAKANGNGCAYLGSDGLKCAAGCFISKAEYNTLMEGNDWSVLVYNGFVTSKHENLIMSLQSIHDYDEPEFWRKELTVLAEACKLSVSYLNKIAVSKETHDR